MATAAHRQAWPATELQRRSDPDMSDDECTLWHGRHWLRHACRMIAAWCANYNHNRPHSSLAGLTPHEYGT